MKKILFITVLSIFSIVVISQDYLYHNIYEKGTSELRNIDFTQSVTFSKTGGDWCQNAVYVADIPLMHGSSYNILHNTQYRNSYNITYSTPYVNPTIAPFIWTDAYGNEFLRLQMSAAAYTGNSFEVYINYSMNTKVNLNDFYPSDQIDQLNSLLPPDIKNNYILGPSVDINSQDPSIIAKANEIVGNENSQYMAVQLLAEFLKGSIKATDPVTFPNPPNAATTVLSNEEGDCDGMSHLVIAMCRSLGIPARIGTCYSISMENHYAGWLGQTWTMGKGNGTGAMDKHAVYEVYYPSIDSWVMGDPNQQTAHFTHATNIFASHGPDQISSHYKGDVPPFTYDPSIETLPIDVGIYLNLPTIAVGPQLVNNLTYIDDDPFFGKFDKDDNILLNVTKGTVIGINDRVTITNPITNFTPGDNVSYNSDFYSYDGDTWPVKYHWYMYLYHDGVEYAYKTNENGSNYWAFTTDSPIPDYNWTRDPSGNIYGKVRLTVELNDGDYKTAEVPVSINYFPNKPNITIENSSNNTITFSFNSVGADGYKVYYGDYFNDLYDGTNAPEGDSPIDVGNTSTFALSNLGDECKIAVSAYNNYGESSPSQYFYQREYKSQIPFTVEFESFNTLNKDYWILSDGDKDSEVSTYDAHYGQNSLLMQSIGSGSWTTNYADLYLKLDYDSEYYLEFWWKHFNDENHDEDGIYFSNDGGLSFEKIYNLIPANYTANTWHHIKFSLANALKEKNKSMTPTSVIRFSHRDNYVVPSDGFAFDDITVGYYTEGNILEDATICENNNPSYLHVNNTNYGSMDRIKADAWTYNNYTSFSDGLLNLDISKIPNNATINLAKLSLFSCDPQPNLEYSQVSYKSTGSNYLSGFKSNQSYLKRITSSWDENSVTFNTCPSFVDDNMVSLDQSLSYTQNYLDINITPLVQDMVNDKENSFGLYLTLKDENHYARMVFASSDHSDASIHPNYSIEYTYPSTSTLTLTANRDARLAMNMNPAYDHVENTNYGTDTRIISEEWTNSSLRTFSKSVFDFDFDAIPSDAIITEAKLSLYACDPQPSLSYSNVSYISTGYNPGFKNNGCLLYRVDSDWEESTVTYNTCPSVVEDNRVYLPISSSYTQDYLEYDVTELVKDIFDNRGSSFGIMMSLMDVEKYARMVFASTDHSNQSLHPKLEISYVTRYSYSSTKSAVPDKIDDNRDEEDNLKPQGIETSIFPNPVSDNLFIENIRPGSRIMIIDLKGSILYSDISESNNEVINTSNLLPGAYIIRLMHTDGIEVHNFIKIKE